MWGCRKNVGSILSSPQEMPKYTQFIQTQKYSFSEANEHRGGILTRRQLVSTSTTTHPLQVHADHHHEGHVDLPISEHSSDAAFHLLDVRGLFDEASFHDCGLQYPKATARYCSASCIHGVSSSQYCTKQQGAGPISHVYSPTTAVARLPLSTLTQ